MTHRGWEGGKKTALDYETIYDIVRYSTPENRREHADRFELTMNYISAIATGHKMQFHPAAIAARKDRKAAE